MFDSTTRTTPLVTTWFRWCPMVFVSINSNTTGVTTRTGSRVLIGPGLFNSLFLGFFFIKLCRRLTWNPPPLLFTIIPPTSWGGEGGGREGNMILACCRLLESDVIRNTFVRLDRLRYPFKTERIQIHLIKT